MAGLFYLTEGARIYLSSIRQRILPRRYDGTAEEICRQIVKDCWNGRFFQTSTGNFRQFWCRDFGWCTRSLLQLGYKEEVHQTLRYALNRFRSAGKITTTLTPRGRPYDFPTAAADSLPWIIHSIALSRFPYNQFKAFLDKELRNYAKSFLDPLNGLVRPELHLSSMKDLALRKSSCYDNCMAGMLAADLKKLKLENPLKNFNYPDLILRHFWGGEYFYDDLQKQRYVAGDANVFPFITGLVTEREKMKLAIRAIQGAALERPFPLKYTASRKPVRFVWQEFFFPDYESTAVWMHMGPLYVKLLQQVDPEKAAGYKEIYRKLILKHGNFLEVFDAEGKPYRSFYYHCDRGMLWAANYLTL